MSLKKKMLIILFIVVLGGCGTNKDLLNTELQGSFNTIINNNNATVIDLNEITKFDWEKAYLFSPYTPRESINKTVGLKFISDSRIDTSDDIYLIVFINKEKVVQYSEIDRHQLDFSIAKGTYLTPENSLITITPQ